MSTLFFGNMPVDMRVPEDDFGIADLQTAFAILDSYEPIDVQVLTSSPSYFAVREVDAQGVYLTLEFWLTGAGGSSLYVSEFGLEIESSGVHAHYQGDFVLAENGDFYGTVNSVDLWNTLSDQTYFGISGIAVSVDGDSELNPESYLQEALQGNDQIYSGQYADYLQGFAGNDLFYALGGDDTIDGGAGVDTAVYQGLLAEYSLAFDRAWDSASVTDSVAGGDDADWLIDVERLWFEDLGIAFDIDGPTSAGGIYRLYQATFDRVPDLDGLGYWILQADDGESGVRMAEDFTWSAEFQQLYGVTTNDNYLSGTDISALVTGFYQHVLHRAPDQGGLDYYVGVVESREKTVGQVLAEIADSPENYAATVAQIQDGIEYLPWVYMLA